MQTPTSAVHETESLLFLLLLQLVLIVAAGRWAGTLAVRVGQSAAVGEILAGIALGPSGFGWLLPDWFGRVFTSVSSAPMTILSQLGLILLMFQIGLEFDFSHLTERRNRRTVLHVAAACLLAPFLLGLVFGYGSAPILSSRADRAASALFVATAFSITALPILGRILMDLRMTQSALGVIAISAAAINDVVGWLLLAGVTALTIADFSSTVFGIKLGLLAAFIVGSWWVVRPLLKRMVRAFQKPGEGLSDDLLALLLVALFLASMCTYALGIFAIFGGFLTGVLLHDEKELRRAWNERVGNFVTVFFLPIFFTYTGLRTRIGALDTVELWGWCGLVILFATLGKFGGAYLAARWNGLGRQESSILGILMNTRALMELVVLNVGYDLGVISAELFTMLVLMALASTVLTTPCVRSWLGPAGVPADLAGMAVSPLSPSARTKGKG